MSKKITATPMPQKKNGIPQALYFLQNAVKKY